MTTGDYELLSPETMPEEAQEELRAWGVARCLVLLHSHEVDVIKVNNFSPVLR